jgi:AcrR family transcriptional regulator
MPRAGLTPARILDEADALVDETGVSDLTLAEIASRLGVKLPSLYKHIAGHDALVRAMTARAKTELAGVLGRSTIGRAGDDAVAAMCHADRDWATRHPGRYELTVRAPRPDDPADQAASAAAVAVVSDVLAGYGLAGDDTIDAIRALRAVVHGFVDLERRGGFGLPVDVDRSFARLIAGFTRLLSAWQAAPRS